MKKSKAAPGLKYRLISATLSLMDTQAENWDHCLQYAALSDVGLRRANNQDSMVVALAGSLEKFLEQGHLFVVADGMGAHAAGELASKLATDIVPQTYRKLSEKPPEEALLDAIRDANTQINRRGSANEDFRGMGTTIDALALMPGGALIAHVGDSRAYRWRNHRLEQLTFDHSLVWELRAAGHVPKDASWHVPANIITRSLGPNAQVQADLEGPFPVRPDDVFLLCSDGLTGQVEDEEIGMILGCLPPEEAVRALVNLANLRGGPDNITVIVVRVTGSVDGDQAGAEAESAGDESTPPRGNQLLWQLLGLSAALAAVGFGTGILPITLIGLAGIIVTGLTALIRRRYRSRAAQQLDEKPEGKGPYVQVDCTPNAQFIARVDQIAEELRQAAEAGGWAIDWDRFNAHAARARQAAESLQYPQAAREYWLAVSFMMDELKSQHFRQQDDDDAADSVL